ncbi:MAG: hypothetical protein EHM61_08460 [Acidobacteria bacterium]|nr:MAG: hypothetical protein EHM61_08460 [Acidobacteriota bacterium]
MRSWLFGQSPRIIILSALLLFLVITSFVVMKSARDALVLTQFSGETLPYFMVATTLLVGLMVAVQLRLNESLSVCSVLAGGLVFYAAGTFLLHVGVHGHWPFAVPIFYGWVGLFGTQIPMLAWSIISRRLHVREAKRAIGTIGGGAVAGSIGGGLIAERVARLGSTPDLLAAAGLLMIAALIPVIGLGLCPRVESADDSSLEAGRVLRPRFVAIVLTIVAAGSIVSTFAEFQFKIIAQQELTTETSLTAFFGWFYAYLGVATLAFQLVVTPLVIRWLGITAGLAVLPLALLGANALIVGFGTLWSAVVLRGGEQLFKHSIDRSSLEVLYTAVTGKARIRLKSLVEAFGVRASESVAGILLIVLFSIASLPLSTIGLLGIVLSLAWFCAAILLRREYTEILTQTIERKGLDIDELKRSLFGPEFHRLLPRLLQTTSTQTWLHLLDLLETSDQRLIGPRLSILLEHQDAQVRRKILRLLFDQPRDYSSDVERLLGDVDRSVRTEAIRYLCSHSPQPMGRLLTFLQDPDPSVRVAACSCSLILEKEESREVAMGKLEEILNHSYDPDQPDLRLEIANVLQDFQAGDAYLRLVRRLMKDSSLEVRRSALKSVSKIRPESLLPVLFANSKEPALWADLRGVLASFGPVVIAYARQLLPAQETPAELKRLILQVISDIGDEPSLALLLEYAENQNLWLRFQAIKGLNRLNDPQELNGFRPRIQQLLDNEIRELEKYRQQQGVFDQGAPTLISNLLAERRQWSEERIFRLLGLLYEQKAVQKAYFAFSEGSSHLFDTALELLDSLLALEHKRTIVPLLENQTNRPDGDPRAPDGRKESLLQFIEQKDQLAAAAALADLRPTELRKWRADLETAVQSLKGQSLVAETLEWRHRQMRDEPSPTESDSLTTIQKLESLSKVTIFSRLGPHELLLLASSSVVQDYGEGEIIYREGETAHHIYNLIKGRVQLRRDPDQVEEISPGGSFGALAVLSRQPRFFTAQVLEPARCIKVEREAFWEMVEDYPSASRAIFEVLSGQILTMMGRLKKDEG